MSVSLQGAWSTVKRTGYALEQGFKQAGQQLAQNVKTGVAGTVVGCATGATIASKVITYNGPTPYTSTSASRANPLSVAAGCVAGGLSVNQFLANTIVPSSDGPSFMHGLKQGWSEYRD